MKYLIAEDSLQKINDLISLLEEIGTEHDSIHVSRSFKESIKSIIDNDYDLVFLDMSLPTSNSGTTSKKRTLAGKDILSTARFYGVSDIKYILFSQFSDFGRNNDVISLADIHDSLVLEYGDIILGYVKYDSAGEDWKRRVINMLEQIS